MTRRETETSRERRRAKRDSDRVKDIATETETEMEMETSDNRMRELRRGGRVVSVEEERETQRDRGDRAQRQDGETKRQGRIPQTHIETDREETAIMRDRH